MAAILSGEMADHFKTECHPKTIRKLDYYVNRILTVCKFVSLHQILPFQINLQIKLTNRTGVDPLEGTVFSNNPGKYVKKHY